MLRANSIISRYLLNGVGTACLLSISQVGFATVSLSHVMAVSIWPSSTYTRVTVESSLLLKYKQFSLTNPDRIVIDIQNVSLNSVLKKLGEKVYNNDPYIKSIRIAQFNRKIVRMVFTLKQHVEPQLFALAPVSKFKERLVIDFYPIHATTDIQDPLLSILDYYNRGIVKKKVFSKKSGLRLRKDEQNHQIVIMLDPGHGGEDTGAVGKYHTREKDIVLKIASILKTLIEREGNMRTYMTRNKDVYIPLKTRVTQAKKQRADLFISIHADAFNNRNPRGSSVFALSNKGATSTAARYLADTQNAADLIVGINKSGDHYVDRTIFDMVQSLTIMDSLRFGKAVLAKLGSINKLHKNSVEQAGFAVLKSPDIPSILVETAFISNIEEERKLKTERFQRQLAESILGGIKAYFSEKKIIRRFR